MKKQSNTDIVEIRDSSISLNIKTEFLNIRYLCASVVGICNMQLMNKNRIEKLEIYISEVASNIVKHAYMCDHSQWIKTNLLVNTEGIKIDIYDWGRSIPNHFLKTENLPTNAIQLDHVSETGRGLYLIQTLTDKFHYIVQHDCNIHRCFQALN